MAVLDVYIQEVAKYKNKICRKDSLVKEFACLKSFDEIREELIYKEGMEKKNDSILHAGGRSYFFDVKTARNNNKYLVLTEKSKEGRKNIIIFEDHVDEFLEKITIALRKVKEQ